MSEDGTKICDVDKYSIADSKGQTSLHKLSYSVSEASVPEHMQFVPV